MTLIVSMSDSARAVLTGRYYWTLLLNVSSQRKGTVNGSMHAIINDDGGNIDLRSCTKKTISLFYWDAWLWVDDTVEE